MLSMLQKLSNWFSFDKKPIGPKTIFDPILMFLSCSSLFLLVVFGILEVYPLLKLKFLYNMTYALPMFVVSGIFAGSILGILSVSDVSRGDRFLFVCSTLVFLSFFSQLAQISILPLTRVLFVVTLFSLLVTSVISLRKLKSASKH